MNAATRNTLFSSKSDDHASPQHIVDQAAAKWGRFVLDVCADDLNHKAPAYYTAATDGLSQDWAADACRSALNLRIIHPVFNHLPNPGKFAIWMNPPYGKTIGVWVKKARETAACGIRVVCLLPARTDTRWWHDEVEIYSNDIQFIRGRLKFGGAKNSAPFPSVLVVF